MSSGTPETRERILNSAWKLLEAAQGREVRMTDIAREAGVSRQALYLHFPARADLLVATTRHIDEVKEVDKRLARSRIAETGTERLAAFIEAWGNYIPEIYGVGKALMIMSETDDAAKLAWDGRMQAVRRIRSGGQGAEERRRSCPGSDGWKGNRYLVDDAFGAKLGAAQRRV